MTPPKVERMSHGVYSDQMHVRPITDIAQEHKLKILHPITYFLYSGGFLVRPKCNVSTLFIFTRFKG